MSGITIEIRRAAKTGKWGWKIIAGNGAILAQSPDEGYTRRANALRAVEKASEAMSDNATKEKLRVPK